MHRLRNGTKHYDWGSPDAIPLFLGDPTSDVPVAEVWIGTHPLSPSMVVGADGSESALSEVVGDLPFMVKLLAAAMPLSLQVHPSRTQAEEGFAREEAAGIPLDAPNRVYKDRNDKPEMVYAITTFDSLIGFRRTAEILRVLGPLNTSLTRRLGDALRADPGFSTIVQQVEWLLTSGVTAAEVHEVVRASATLAERGLDIKRAYQTAVEVAEHFPDDVGVIIALMLNRMTLQPGEAAYLGAGVIHAHLKGLCVEVMTNSDNVLRAGLTRKHVDAEGLVASLSRGMARIAQVTPDNVDFDTDVFAPGEGEFAVAVSQVSSAAPDGVVLERTEGGILLCTSGVVTVAADTGPAMTLGRGESLYLTPKDSPVRVRGLGEVVHAYVPSARSPRSRLVDVV